MLDIVEIKDGSDLRIASSSAPRAANVASTQMGEKNFLPASFGADLKYFLASEFQFQEASFQSYIVQRLIQHQINVGQVVKQIFPLKEKLTFPVQDTQPTQGGLVSS